MPRLVERLHQAEGERDTGRCLTRGQQRGHPIHALGHLLHTLDARVRVVAHVADARQNAPVLGRKKIVRVEGPAAERDVRRAGVLDCGRIALHVLVVPLIHPDDLAHGGGEVGSGRIELHQPALLVAGEIEGRREDRHRRIDIQHLRQTRSLHGFGARGVAVAEEHVRLPRLVFPAADEKGRRVGAGISEHPQPRGSLPSVLDKMRAEAGPFAPELPEPLLPALSPERPDMNVLATDPGIGLLDRFDHELAWSAVVQEQ